MTARCWWSAMTKPFSTQSGSCGVSNWRLEPSDHARDRQYGVGEGCGRLLREIVADAAANRTVLVATGKARSVCRRLWVRRTVGVTLHGNCRHRDRRGCRKRRFGRFVAWLALSEAQPPAIIVDDNRDMVGVVEAAGRAFVSRIVEMPLGRGGLPDQLVERLAVLLIADPAALGREVELIPPREFGFWRQRRSIGLLAADEVAADRDEARTSLRPKRGHDICGARAPVEPA